MYNITQYIYEYRKKEGFEWVYPMKLNNLDLQCFHLQSNTIKYGGGEVT